MGLLSIDGRSDAIHKMADRFEIAHINNPDARQIGISFARLAQELILRIRRPGDEPGLLDALEKLLEAREEAIVAIAPEPRKVQARAAVHSEPEPEPEPEPEEEPERKAPSRRTKTTASSRS